MATIHAILLAGGSGTRFWPASRRARPKQFLPMAGERSLLAATRARLDGLVPPERTLVVTAADQVELVRRALPELPAENVLAEPRARNTAAAVLLAALEVRRRDPASVQLVLPSDQVVHPAEALRRTLAAGAAEAEGGSLVVFGIRPTHPATGFGYVELGEPLRETPAGPVRRAARFVEKPERARAEEFLRSGRFLWNAGIFAWRTDAILASFARHLPEALRLLEGARTPAELARAYQALPSVPVDVAILEKSGDVRVLAIDYAWSDVGAWSALADVAPADADGNWRALSDGARLVAEDSSGCVVHAEGSRVVALLGVRDLVVVQTADATLVCPRERAQDVKRVVERLEREGGGAFL